MSVSTVDYKQDTLEHSRPTYDTTTSNVRRRRWPRIGGVIVMTVITAPIAFRDPRHEARASGASTLQSQYHRTRKRKITLSEAWAKAGHIFANAQKKKIEQREREARIFLSIFMEDDE